MGLKTLFSMFCPHFWKLCTFLTSLMPSAMCSNASSGTVIAQILDHYKVFYLA